MSEVAQRDVGEAFRPPAASLPPWLPTRKRNRLPLDVYREPGQFFVTIRTEGHHPWLRERKIVGYCATALRDVCDAQGFTLIAYCFMPDHVHLLVTTETENDLVRLLHLYKQRTGWWFRNRRAAGGLKASPTSPSPGLWQKSYHDHILRREEDISDVIRYILENPVRAGLTDSVEHYPYAWSAFGLPEPV